MFYCSIIVLACFIVLSLSYHVPPLSCHVISFVFTLSYFYGTHTSPACKPRVSLPWLTHTLPIPRGTHSLWHSPRGVTVTSTAAVIMHPQPVSSIDAGVARTINDVGFALALSAERVARERRGVCTIRITVACKTT